MNLKVTVFILFFTNVIVNVNEYCNKYNIIIILLSFVLCEKLLVLN